MKLSKTLLNAMLIGITVGGLTSCEKADLPGPTHECDDNCETVCTTGEGGETPKYYDNCPACGMG